MELCLECRIHDYDRRRGGILHQSLLVACGREEVSRKSVGRRRDDARMDASEPTSLPPIFDTSTDRLTNPIVPRSAFLTTQGAGTSLMQSLNADDLDRRLKHLTLHRAHALGR